jgi:hypothetical protein
MVFGPSLEILGPRVTHKIGENREIWGGNPPISPIWRVWRDI